MEIYIPIISDLLELIRETKLKLSSMPSSTVQEMESWDKLLKVLHMMEQNLENDFSLLYLNLKNLQEQLDTLPKKDILRDWMEENFTLDPRTLH